MSVLANPHRPNQPLSRPRVVIADDHPAVLVVMRRILEPHCDVVATAVDGETLLQQVERLWPDVVVTGIFMPRMNGLEACGCIRRKHPTVTVIIISETDDDDLFLGAVRSRASALLRKHEIAQTLPAAVLLLASV